MLAVKHTFDFPVDRRFIEPLALSVVIPTLNERDNVARLFQKLTVALAGLEWEAIFVDDGSDDGTVEAVTRISRDDRRARLISRVGRRGLSTAVIEGMLSSTAPVVAVIDADLQHDESVLPQLIAAVYEGACDLAVGSRYTLGGSVGEWSVVRERISRIATRLAEIVTEAPLADPMSGFFAIRRDRVLAAAPHLSGKGYKVLLDLISSSPTSLTIQEFPYKFRPRDSGESKLDAMVMLEYVQLLAEKIVGRWVPVQFLMFALVGTLGVGVHIAALAACLHVLAIPFLASMMIATTAAMTFNFALNNIFTYRSHRLRGWRILPGLMKYYLVCGTGAVANIGIAHMLYHSESWWFAGAAGAIIGCVWNYLVGGHVTWRTRK